MDATAGCTLGFSSVPILKFWLPSDVIKRPLSSSQRSMPMGEARKYFDYPAVRNAAKGTLCDHAF